MPRYANMTDDPSYQALVQELAAQCTCTPESDRPCSGLLAGGPGSGPINQATLPGAAGAVGVSTEVCPISARI
jgi:hypothetical protein